MVENLEPCGGVAAMSYCQDSKETSYSIQGDEFAN
jgi:hypothetical protein